MLFELFVHRGVAVTGGSMSPSTIMRCHAAGSSHLISFSARPGAAVSPFLCCSSARWPAQLPARNAASVRSVMHAEHICRVMYRAAHRWCALACAICSFDATRHSCRCCYHSSGAGRTCSPRASKSSRVEPTHDTDTLIFWAASPSATSPAGRMFCSSVGQGRSEGKRARITGSLCPCPALRKAASVQHSRWRCLVQGSCQPQITGVFGWPLLFASVHIGEL